jgi:hypothetical protein
MTSTLGSGGQNSLQYLYCSELVSGKYPLRNSTALLSILAAICRPVPNCIDLRRNIVLKEGMRWRRWLSHCATSRTVAGSIPDSVTGNFHLHNPSDQTMGVGSIQILREMSKVKQSCYRPGVAQMVPGS